ncbi:putative lysyl-tRNA synthetase [Aspergillus saccharolyticus JOP 1030-1]|uniref:Lysine--tRNA ligase n=1 Tax=Aspergillus saccharolyticus JOP 1030-1 TaxID=1450539 RepID=A0A318ZBK6_9EURO|nr:lysyl-tRNA synthetase [Aspergillus saccharolyticus JOP 1030-1]PYH44815.1 lysyl-tRNA synthetase [Aspergillus saccharolyticus JOP 1030-1]
MHSIRPQWASRLRVGKALSSTGAPISTRTQALQTNGKFARVNQFFPAVHASRHSSSAASPERAFQERLQAVQATFPEAYPRFETSEHTVSCAEFRERYDHLVENEVEAHTVVVNGRVRTYRLAGNKLIFFDMFHSGHKLQVMCNISQLEGVTPEHFKKFYRLLRRGDAFSVTGRPHRTARGELTVLATQLPQLLSPCLHDVPLDAHTHETSPYPRHVQFLADSRTADTIRARSAIIQYLRQFFLDRKFMEVNTPILEAVAGGAIARPFHTSATEFPDRQLSLRIAPELWLKRLVIGGFDKVFEIGPSFRNEGLDKTHNPEFTTCEFYHTYANLDDLISITEKLLSGLSEHIHALNTNNTLTPTEVNFTAPFRRIDFITGIEAAIGRKLPDLTGADALAQVKALYRDLSLPEPSNPTLPRLLDGLCSEYLEPQCIDPTFIINPPECLSPLSKSFVHPMTGHRVGARAELFVEGREVVNTYEEENSPFEQRRKFEDQVRFSKEANETEEIDESYLEALEWGLPSTGGWGCGIDRLCMLFTGAKKIGDVLPFGSLRQVTRPVEKSEK